MKPFLLENLRRVLERLSPTTAVISLDYKVPIKLPEFTFLEFVLKGG